VIIGCDVDGVIADLHTEWLHRYNAEYGDAMRVTDIICWDIHKLVRPECGTHIYAYLSDPDLYANVPLVEGARFGVGYLRAMGHRVVFITSNAKGMTDQKWRWLERWGFLPAGDTAIDLVCATDKSFFAVDAMIEDYAENLRESRASLRLLLSRPWNVAADGPWCRVPSWVGICEYFSTLAGRATA
jgi:5'(3')-deoxyribonucleotidase